MKTFKEFVNENKNVTKTIEDAIKSNVRFVDVYMIDQYGDEVSITLHNFDRTLRRSVGRVLSKFGEIIHDEMPDPETGRYKIKLK